MGAQNHAKPIHAIVLGLGNVLLSDDGLGVVAVQRLAADCRVPESVHRLDGGTLGLALLGYLGDASHLLLLDAVDIGAAPGTLVRMDETAFSRLTSGASVHDIGAADLVAALRLQGREPAHVVLLGVQPASTALGTELSADVATAMDRLVDAAVTELARWSANGDSDDAGTAGEDGSCMR